jgi:transcriptional regulator with XRE-family HTH domain
VVQIIRAVQNEGMTDAAYERLLRQIAKNIQTRRKALGYTQENMAERGFNYRYWQKLESGAYSPTLRTLYRIAKTLNTTVNVLIK